MRERTDVLKGYLEFDLKKERLDEVEMELAQPDVWNQPERAQELGRERASLEAIVHTIEELDRGVADFGELLEMAAA